MNISKLFSSPLPLPSNRSLNAFPHRKISKKYPFQLFYHNDFFKYFCRIPDCFNSPSISHSEKTYISVIYTDYTRKKADPQLTKMILFNMFQIFQINKINFQQYLILHNHPDTFIHKCDATTQTDYTTIRPKSFPKKISNRTRTLLEKEKLISYWPSDDNDSTDDELQKDTPEAILDQNSSYKTYTYIAF